jgi:hypothetical protein
MLRHRPGHGELDVHVLYVGVWFAMAAKVRGWGLFLDGLTRPATHPFSLPPRAVHLQIGTGGCSDVVS